MLYSYRKNRKYGPTRWRAYERTFSDGRQETRLFERLFIGKRRSQQYWQLITDKETYRVPRLGW